MNKDCKVSIERDANGSLKMQLFPMKRGCALMRRLMTLKRRRQ